MLHIEIVAGMGVGKTSLAELLKEEGFTIVDECFEANPFLYEFYSDPQSAAFELQMTFMMQSYFLTKKASEEDKNYIIESSLLLSYAYCLARAELGLTSVEELTLSKSVYDLTSKACKKPDLRIYLNCSPETQKARIERRAREFEEGDGVAPEFLEALSKSVKKLVEENPDNCQTLVIDAEKYNWVDSEKDKKTVVDVIKKALANKLGPEFNKAATKPGKRVYFLPRPQANKP